MTGLAHIHLSDVMSLKSNLSNKLPEIGNAIERNITQMAMRPFERVFANEIGLDELDAEEFILVGAVITERIDHVFHFLRNDIVQAYHKYWDLPILKLMYPNEGLQERVVCRNDNGRFRVMVQEEVEVLGVTVDTLVEVGDVYGCARPTHEELEMYAGIGRVYIRQMINKRNELDFTYVEEGE
jgi:hypothetical protein